VIGTNFHSPPKTDGPTPPRTFQAMVKRSYEPEPRHLFEITRSRVSPVAHPTQATVDFPRLTQISRAPAEIFRVNILVANTCLHDFHTQKMFLATFDPKTCKIHASTCNNQL
jgi:hypothetical protein